MRRRRKRKLIPADASIGPPFYLLKKTGHGQRRYLEGNVNGRRDGVITGMKYCDTYECEKMMERILVLAKADAERMRKELTRQRRVYLCSLDLD